MKWWVKMINCLHSSHYRKSLKNTKQQHAKLTLMRCYLHMQGLLRVQYSPVPWTVHGFEGKSVLFNIKGKHVVTVMLPVARGFPEFTVVHVRRQHLSEVTLVIFLLEDKWLMLKFAKLELNSKQRNTMSNCFKTQYHIFYIFTSQHNMVLAFGYEVSLRLLCWRFGPQLDSSIKRGLSCENWSSVVQLTLWIPNLMTLLGSDGNFQRQGLFGGHSSPDVCLGPASSESGPLYLSFLSSWLSGGELLCSSSPSIMMPCLSPAPDGRASQQWMLGAKMNPSSFKLFQVSYRTKSQTDANSIDTNVSVLSNLVTEILYT